MTMTMKTTALMMALTTLTACERFTSADYRRERADSVYQAAMTDYRAGRLPQAITGLKKVCHDDPANSSARFQLACLLQDSAKDYLGALTAFRAYLDMRPESDRSKLAQDRMKTCERELAEELAKKYGFNDAATAAEKIVALNEVIKSAEKRNAKLSKDLATAMQRVSALSQETERLRGIIGRDNEKENGSSTDVSMAMALLKDEEKEGAAPAVGAIPDEKDLIEDDESTSSSLIRESPDAKTKRDLARRQSNASATSAPAAEKVARPRTYVVEDGDTLYKLAVKFYGTSSAWVRIRDANKAIISNDGRIRAGQKLTLP